MNATSKDKKMLVDSLTGQALTGGTAVVGLTAANAATVPPAPPIQASQDGNEADESA